MIIFRDCYPRGQDISIRDSTRYEICRRAMIERLEADENHVFGDSSFIKEFYRCLILLNSQETRDNTIRVSVAKDYFQNSAEICYLGKVNLLQLWKNLEFSIDDCDIYYRLAILCWLSR